MITINPDDLDIVTGCAAVHPDQRGGQHVAMACAGVRVTHKPTGMFAFSEIDHIAHTGGPPR